MRHRQEATAPSTAADRGIHFEECVRKLHHSDSENQLLLIAVRKSLLSRLLPDIFVRVQKPSVLSPSNDGLKGVHVMQWNLKYFSA